MVTRRVFLTTAALAPPVLTSGAALASEPTAKVVPGADALAAQGWRALSGRRVGVLSNPTGILANLDHIVDSMVTAGVRPVAAFGPEHGFRGSSQAGGSEGDYADPRTGIAVYDAYGASADKLASMFTEAGVDMVVFDIADVGARFYTYIWTMYTAMSAVARAGTDFLVLDRPNPIGGAAAGPLLDPAFASGVGLAPIVQQHGMTAGELARFFAGEFLGPVKVDVVPVRGWRRETFFADTGLTWTPPSPNLPTPGTALVYPGLCMFEGTVFSEGRGTTRPFETVGAPGVDWRWRDALSSLGLPGAEFRETYFVPTFGKFVNQACGGVQVVVTDARTFDAIETAVAMLVTAKRLYPALFGWRQDNWIDKLTGSARLRTMIDEGAGTHEITGSWRTELETFTAKRKPYLLYR